MLVDTHAHLNDEGLYPRAQEIYDGMADNGLSAIVNVGYDTPSSLCAVELSERYDKFFAVVGIHPHDAKTATEEDYALFEKLVKENDKVLAIGEIGLDFHYDLSPREDQGRVFIEQLRLAHGLKMPVVVHLREAYGVMSRILKENEKYLEYGVLLHCYSGSKELVKEYAKYDFYYSFGGAVTFKNAVDKPDVVRSVPIDRLLLETDCPYMTPVPYRGTPNEPKYINLVADRVAEILQKEKKEVEEITFRNTERFFKRLGGKL